MDLCTLFVIPLASLTREKYYLYRLRNRRQNLLL